MFVSPITKLKKIAGIDAAKKPSAVEALSAYQGTSKKPAVLIACLVDNSSSMGKESGSQFKNVPRYMAQKGIHHIASSYEKEAVSTGIDYYLTFVTLNGDDLVVLPFTHVEDVKNCSIPPIEAKGITCFEPAIRQVWKLIDDKKEQLDNAGVDRLGTILVMITDGSNTNEDGKRTPLSQAFVDEIAARAASHAVTPLAFGMGGRIDEAQLRQLAPGSSLVFKGGKCFENPRAFVVEETDWYKPEVFESLTKVVVNVSSSSADFAESDDWNSEPVYIASGDSVPAGYEGPVVYVNEADGETLNIRAARG